MSAIASVKTQYKKGYLRSYNNKWAFLFITPQIIGLLAFLLIPILCSFYLTLVDWDFINPARWVGFDNFRAVFSDPIFFQAMGNTLYLALGIVPLTMASALFLAVCANRPRLAGLSIFKGALFLPMVTSTVAISMVWFWLYAPDYGMINLTLHRLFGIEGPGWLTTTQWSKPAIILLTVWRGVGYTFIIFLAGLKGISREYYEAAELDGAGEIRKFLSITFPLLSPVIFFVMVTSMVSALGIFNEVYMITDGGPLNSSYTAMLYLYNYAFRFGKMGQAAVMSMSLAVVQIVFAIVQFKFSRKWVNYSA